MLLRKTVQKTKTFFNKTLQNVKSFIFGGYKKLTNPPSVNPFSTSVNNPNMQQLDHFYKEFCDQWDSNSCNINPKNKVLNENANNTTQEQKSVVIRTLEEGKDAGRSKCGNKSDILERKMKDLEMMDVNDEEHVLDIEEVLHYYSRLTSPVYQDLVDKFFTDMHSEFLLPQPSIKSRSMNGSMRRLGPLNI